MLHYQNYINGEFITSNLDPLIVENPATEHHACTVDLLSTSQVLNAVDGARTAQISWGQLCSAERGQYLQIFANKIIELQSEIAQALVRESGKSLSDAGDEVTYAAEIVRYHAEWARRIEGEIIPSDSRQENLLLMREPIGVVACLIPFNFPVYTLLRKIAPALITGNSVVIRPSNQTPSSALVIAKAAHMANFPAGVINFMCMSHASAEQMCTHPGVGMITLTGSVSAGRRILDYCKEHIAKPSLELGGKTPAIIADDANIPAVAAALVASKTTHCGQLCTAIERVYAQKTIYLELVKHLQEHMNARSFGDRSIRPDAMGPLISSQARMHAHQMVQRAVEQGATLVTGGYIPEGKGYFYPPTLLVNCRQDMEIVQEETFAPIMAVLAYDTIEQALKWSNDHQFGLASVLYTERYRDIMYVANHIHAGELYVNRTPADPYQGYHAGWKRSGLGGDDGKHGMLEFTQTRLVVMNY